MVVGYYPPFKVFKTMTAKKVHILYGKMTEEELINLHKVKREARIYGGGEELREIQKELERRRLRRIQKHNPKEYKKRMLEKPADNNVKIPTFRGLTAMQEKFCMEFAGHGDEVKAYTAAGYQPDKTDARTRAKARIIMKNEKIMERIKEYQDEAITKVTWTKEKVLERLAKVYNEAMQDSDFTNANKSMEHIAKHLGMFVDKVEQTVKTTGFESGDKKKDVERLVKIAGLKVVSSNNEPKK